MTKRRSLRSRLAAFFGRKRRRGCSNDSWEIAPDEEDALVPVGPRRPRPSSAVALELPPEPKDIDAYGLDSTLGEGDEPSAAVA